MDKIKTRLVEISCWNGLFGNRKYLETADLYITYLLSIITKTRPVIWNILVKKQVNLGSRPKIPEKLLTWTKASNRQILHASAFLGILWMNCADKLKLCGGGGGGKLHLSSGLPAWQVELSGLFLTLQYLCGHTTMAIWGSSPTPVL